jgi:hypothetical protein
MAVTNFSPLLGLALPTTGDLSGTWGTTVNDSITQLIDSAVAGTTALSTDANVTLSTTNGAANQARNAVLLCTGARTTLKTITAPAQSKAYIVINATTGGFGVKVVGSGPTTGVTIPNGGKALIAWNGSDFVIVSSGVINLTSEVTGILPVANGGTATATPALIAGSGVTISGVWPNQTINATGSGGTLTSVGLSMPSGFSVANSPITTSGTLAVTTTLNGLLKGTGSAFTTATVGTDYVAPGTATNFTALQTFTGTSSNMAAKLLNAKEAVTISATAATGTINYDVTTQSVLYYTSNASANWTLNIRASSGTSLNSALSTGESVTVAFFVTNGATAYYQSAFQVDGSSVTPKWQGGAAPSVGFVNSVDIYVFTVIKTASATFSVFASQTQFA